jgi:primosomal protein N'
MVMVECPWCDGPLPLEADGPGLRCEACSVAVDLAGDPASAPELAAAA